MTGFELATAARAIGRVCRTEGLVVPGFRSPPEQPVAVRSIRWHTDASCTIAVRSKGRREADVIADMIDGAVEAQHGTIDRARLRVLLRDAFSEVVRTDGT